MPRVAYERNRGAVVPHRRSFCRRSMTTHDLSCWAIRSNTYLTSQQQLPPQTIKYGKIRTGLAIERAALATALPDGAAITPREQVRHPRCERANAELVCPSALRRTVVEAVVEADNRR